MCENPISLEELSLDAVCDNLLSYVELYYVANNLEIPSQRSGESSDDNSELDSEFVKKYRFKDPEVFLINEISEKLLRKLCDKKMLCDASLSIFTERNTKLRKVKLKNCKVTKEGLSVLEGHKIVELECVNLQKVSIGGVLGVLSQWSKENIVYANFSRSSFIDVLRHNLVVKLTQLTNIRCLNVSYTELNQQGLEMLCQDLKVLEKFDISGTLVRNLDPLLMIAEKLVNLSVCDLYKVDNFTTTLIQLKQLRHLDVSLCSEKVDYTRRVEDYPVVFLLENTHCLPQLTSLDISGWKNIITKHTLLQYLDSHPNLQYLGLVVNDLTFEQCFCDPNSVDYRDNLIIAGLGTDHQIVITLKKYIERSHYVQKALYYLFQLTNTFQDARSDMFKLVLPVMEMHCSKFGVQMAATACLYNLTRGDLSKNMHPNLLSVGVSLTMNAMTMFPDEFQLQKNSLLTLCSDRILQEVPFDKFRCAKLVLDSLCKFDDVNMNRMAVAICSILAAKISTDETSKLGARPKYMRKLLSLVQSRVKTKVSDITLKFTLSALWNLTDESAATCEVFLEQEGAYLFLDVLRTFRDESTVETKILGLLNNIAEVQNLRHHLMIESLVDEFLNLLRSDNIDVSYFAAGIVAHLTSDGPDYWTITKHSRCEMLEELGRVVSGWDLPESEMVAYRSFQPFFPLLRLDMDYQVQLWAVWAIQHVCTKNPKRYCDMLQDENGHLLLVDLAKSGSTNLIVRNIASRILDILNVAP